MRYRFFDAPRPLLFGHRGGAGLAPENTLAAFDAGVAAGADGLELDVRASQDGVVVVHHDRTVDRTTNGRGDIASFTARELAALDAGYWSGGDGHPFRGAGIGVPTLAEVLARHRDCRVIIEMKINSADFAEAVVNVVRAARAVERVCLGAFSRRALQAARRLAPALATSASRAEVRWAVYRSLLRWPVSRVAYGGYQVPQVAEGTRIVTPRFVRHAHDAGLAVQVWTVNDPQDARRLLSWRADALITDRPDVLAPIVRAEGQEGLEGREGR